VSEWDEGDGEKRERECGEEQGKRGKENGQRHQQSDGADRRKVPATADHWKVSGASGLWGLGNLGASGLGGVGTWGLGDLGTWEAWGHWDLGA